jgi:YesN/AraC family two-component response regulator
MIKVLIVDDNMVIAGLIKEMLEQEGNYHVKTAANGSEGYLISLRFTPDIIITDIQMPIKNGLEMISEIRNHDPAIKTIYMSADPNSYRTRLEEEKTKYHANFIEKPFSQFELVGALSQSMLGETMACAT